MCHEHTEGRRCRRCGTPLCSAHAPRAVRRCDRCEEVHGKGRGRAVALMGALQLAVVFLMGFWFAYNQIARPSHGVSSPLSEGWTFAAALAVMAGPAVLFLPLRRVLFLIRRRAFTLPGPADEQRPAD